MTEFIIGLLALLAGLAVGWVYHRRLRADEARQASGLLETARKEADVLRREAQMAAQEEALQARRETEEEAKQRRHELAEMESRLLQREANVDRKVERLEQKAEELAAREQQQFDREKEAHRVQEEIDAQRQRVRQELERASELSAEEARKVLLAQVEEQVRSDAVALARPILEEARESANREAKRLITVAIERCASDHVQSATTCTVTLPSEDMKGRIIGREGRNIRAFEAATGINVLIDDTPQSVVLSGFDPVRRELARQTLERLVGDGRINPARIEEEVAKVTQEMEQMIAQAGEEAVLELGLAPVHPDLVKTLGRLKFRHSFSQNVLDHSVEVAHLAGMLASELGLDQRLAKRVGLFHDVGKAVNHEVEGSHALIGAQLLRKHGEVDEVVQGVACHHHEAEPLTVYGMLASTADAISASRPGARSESMELYLARLEKLEAIANSFPGVEKSYALQAGREIRVFVEPSRVSDDGAVHLAHEVRRKIEQELMYPGQVRITVVRETRAIEYAR